ncbi:hypothetical protein [Herbaspirillum seropedicae]|uniref:hypothetical protein n=1 Tax=Herbaspirillum seropedicae TaxID=964 RepID=UPI003D96AF5F
MNRKLVPISFGEAKSIAEQHAFVDFRDVVKDASQVLKKEYLEAEYCWMFFRNDQIVVPLEATLGMKWAYVVSKKGTYSMVQDFSGDEKKLLDYLNAMSDHFKKRDE